MPLEVDKLFSFGRWLLLGGLLVLFALYFVTRHHIACDWKICETLVGSSFRVAGKELERVRELFLEFGAG